MTPERYSPEDCRLLLSLAGPAIREYISLFYGDMTRRNLGSHIQRPSIAIMDLGNDTLPRPVLSDIGHQKGTGWYQEVQALHERVRPYWRSVEATGFIPEVRLFGVGRRETHALLVRDTPYEP